MILSAIPEKAPIALLALGVSAELAIIESELEPYPQCLDAGGSHIPLQAEAYDDQSLLQTFSSAHGLATSMVNRANSTSLHSANHSLHLTRRGRYSMLANMVSVLEAETLREPQELGMRIVLLCMFICFASLVAFMVSGFFGNLFTRWQLCGPRTDESSCEKFDSTKYRGECKATIAEGCKAAQRDDERSVQRGTLPRMQHLPPTALPSLGPSLLSEERTSSRSHPTNVSTNCSSMLESVDLVIPPVLVSDFTVGDEPSAWTVPYENLHALLEGDQIAIQGSSPLHARLLSNDRGQLFLELGRFDTIANAPAARIGSLGTDLVAQIVRADGTLYGALVPTGSGFAVRHESCADYVLALEPVTTDKGAFLEVSGGGGHPICLVRLNDRSAPGVEIDADPDVDAILIVSCVLASIVCSPALQAVVPRS